MERIDSASRPERLERLERRKNMELSEEEPKRKNGLLNVVMVQVVLCLAVAIVLLFGNLIAEDSVTALKDYYGNHIQSNNDLEDDFRSIGEQVWSFLQQGGGEGESDSSQEDSRSDSDSANQSADSSQSGSSSDSANSTENSVSDSTVAGATSQDTNGSVEATPKKTAGTSLVSAKISSPPYYSMLQASIKTGEPVWEQTEMNFSVEVPSQPEKKPDVVKETVSGLAVPLTGEVTSGYGYRLHPIYGLPDFHKGVDIGAEEGTPFVAAMPGIVRTAGNSVTFGYYLVLEHDDGLVTRYGHCSQLLVEEGQEIQAGDVIGLVGSTGEATGPHLHFDVSRDGTYFDPYQLIESFAP